MARANDSASGSGRFDDLVRIRLPARQEGPARGVSRREMLQMLGTGIAATAAGGCTRDLPDQILPYNRRPIDVTPGVPNWYATSMVMDGYATGLLVESHEGRPTKIEGNPDHPASLGAADVFHQASIRELYDPQRAERIRRRGESTSWAALFAALRAPRADGGAGLRILLEPTSSPLVHDLLDRALRRHPAARAVFHLPLDRGNVAAGARLAFGRPLLPQADLSRADVVVALDANVLGEGPFHLRHARQLAERRRVPARAVKGAPEMSRLYVVETMLSETGTLADHRLRARSSEVAAVAGAIASALPSLPAGVREAVTPFQGWSQPFARAVARDLASRPPGTTLILVGARQPPEVHALGHAMNAALGNLGRTATAIAPVLPARGDAEDLGELAADIRAGRVDTLVILERNVCYDGPADLDLPHLVASVLHSVYLGLYEDETAEACEWFGPAAHYLETWGDARAYDGTLSTIQPLVRPLRGGRAAVELLAAIAGLPPVDASTLFHDSWRARQLSSPTPLALERALRRGCVEDTAFPVLRPELDEAGAADAVRRLSWSPPPGDLVEVGFYPSPTAHDGRFAHNAWLLEQPAPVAKLCWDNAAFLSPATAHHLGVGDEDLVEIEREGRRLEAPVLVVPGHADLAVSLWLGLGRRGGVGLAAGIGVDAYRLRTSTALAFAADGRLRRTGGRHPLARAPVENLEHGRPIAVSTTLAAYRRDPSFTAGLKGPVDSLYPEVAPGEGPQWAMTIDLGACTGCGACAVACRAENNILVVGRDEVLRGRMMDWLRIDTYFSGSADEPHAVNQPMACQHCEDAPCEYVCPVNATVHSPDGLNEMIYNRCVGTRFCSNNCPYKVRRFNFFDWSEREPANQGLVRLQRNPDVTVRERGVMEKCTYCVQRIRRTQIRAELEDRAIRPGEVVTACQQTCPTKAITFGSLTHPDAEVVLRRAEPRSYAVLHEQGTRPRTLYLARVDNPNPELTK